MPTYKFINNNTQEEYELFLSISERTTYLEENKNVTQVLNGAPSLGDSIRLGLRKPDSSFRDRLKEIKKSHSKGLTKSTVNTFG